MSKKSIYNKIKYGLVTIFPKEHPNFSIDNNAMIISYNKVLDSGKSMYGQIEINKDESIYMWIFLTRDTGDDIPILDHIWENVQELLEDKDIDNCLILLGNEYN